MLKPKKRRLYTPITPPSEDENDADKGHKLAEKTDAVSVKQIPEKM